MRRLVFSLWLMLTSACVFSAELQPFRTDGCGVFPNGTTAQNRLWLSCCIEQDKAYWIGGTYEERERADIELKSCVAQVGKSDVARHMLVGVRVGGTPYLPTSFRWGYGWPYPRGYKALTDTEIAEVQAEM